MRHLDITTLGALQARLDDQSLDWEYAKELPADFRFKPFGDK